MKTRDIPFFRYRDLEAIGLTAGQLHALVRHGNIERVSRGLYRWSKTPVTENFTLLAVARTVPKGVLCLLTALRLHGIGTQEPHEVWVAIHPKARTPRRRDLPLKIVRFSGTALTFGVEKQQLDGGEVRVTNPARTVVDCFRYRNKIGLDIALEALQETLRGKKATREQIFLAAKACRARNVIRPYLEALSR